MTSFFTSKKNTSKAPSGAKQGYTSFGFKKEADTYSNPQLDQNHPHSKGRPGGCWVEDEENELDTLMQQEIKQNSQKVPSIFIASKASTKDSLDKLPSSERSNLSQKETTSLDLITPDREFLNKHNYENKVVNDIIVPGGMRLKQPDANLNSFCSTCGSLNAQIIGSLLINKTTDQINWISKARALYAIEALVKKFDKYAQFFKHNIKTLRGLNFGEEETNNEQLRKILDEVLNHLEQTKSLSVTQKKAVSLPLRVESASTTDNEEPSDQTLQTVESQKAKSPIYVKENKPIAPSKFASAGSNTPSISQANATANTSPNNMTNLPLNQMSGLASSLSDLDFSGASPFNVQESDSNRVTASWDTFSPLHYQNRNMDYNQAYYQQNMRFNQAYQNMQNMQNTQNRAGYYQNYQQNMMNIQKQANDAQPQQQEGPQNLWNDEAVFKQDFGIDYNAEENKRKAQQVVNEKKFDNLDFKF